MLTGSDLKLPLIELGSYRVRPASGGAGPGRVEGDGCVTVRGAEVQVSRGRNGEALLAGHPIPGVAACGLVDHLIHTPSACLMHHAYTCPHVHFLSSNTLSQPARYLMASTKQRAALDQWT